MQNHTEQDLQDAFRRRGVTDDQWDAAIEAVLKWVDYDVWKEVYVDDAGTEAQADFVTKLRTIAVEAALAHDNE